MWLRGEFFSAHNGHVTSDTMHLFLLKFLTYVSLTPWFFSAVDLMHKCLFGLLI